MSQNTEFKVGDVIGNRFDILDCLGQSAVGRSFLVADKERNGAQVVLKHLSIPCTGDDVFNRINSKISPLFKLKNKSFVELYGFYRLDPDLFIIYEYVQGEPLNQHLATRRENGQILGAKAAYSLVALICMGLEAVNGIGRVHGALTPDNILVTAQGRIKVTNMASAYIAENYLDPTARAAYFHSKFIAPEANTQKDKLTYLADVYSCALIAAELLSAFSFSDFKGTPEEFVDNISGISDNIKNILKVGVNPRPEKRYRNVSIFKENFKNAVDAPADTDLSSIVLGVSDLRNLAGSSMTTRRNDLFDRAQSSGRDRGEVIWIVQKDGLDYGPFDKKGVLDMLYRDEITEYSMVLNMSTQRRLKLINTAEFEEDIKAYIPERDKKQAEAQAEKDRKMKKIKKASAVSSTAVIIAGIAFAVVSIMAYLALPDPKPLDLKAGSEPFPFLFKAPKVEEISLNVNMDKARALFDPKASAAEREAALKAWEAEHARKFASRRKAAGLGSGSGSDEDEIYTIDFGMENGKEVPPLKDWEIEEQLYSGSMLRKESDCILKYSGGRRISVSVDFIIAQTGQVRKITTTAGGELDSCIKNAIGSMRFRHFGGTIKKVTGVKISLN